MVCFRHMLKTEVTKEEKRLNSIFEKKPSQDQDLIIFTDPPLQPGNDKILQQYKTDQAPQNNTESDEINSYMQNILHQDFDIKETIALMEKQLASAVEKGSQILQAAKGMSISQKMNLLYKYDKSGKKLSNDEIYILSQKNLVKTMDRINEKIKSQYQDNQDDSIMKENETDNSQIDEANIKEENIKEENMKEETKENALIMKNNNPVQISENTLHKNTDMKLEIDASGNIYF